MMFGTPTVHQNVRPRALFEQHPRYVRLTRATGHDVFVERGALSSMVAETKGNSAARRREMAFLCMGRRLADKEGSYTVIQTLPFLALGEATHVKLTPNDKRRAREQHPHLDVLGFAHTHPGYGVFFSHGDVAAAEGFGTDGVHLVLDPIGNEIGIGLGTSIVDSKPLASIGGLESPMDPARRLLASGSEPTERAEAGDPGPGDPGPEGSDAAPLVETTPHAEATSTEATSTEATSTEATSTGDAGADADAARAHCFEPAAEPRRPRGASAPRTWRRWATGAAWVATMCLVGACALSLARLNRLVAAYLDERDPAEDVTTSGHPSGRAYVAPAGADEPPRPSEANGAAMCVEDGGA